MSELRQEFEKSFPIPAHWIEWSESKNRYDCHVGLADSKCAEYNKMFNVWCVRQAKIDELQLKNAELARIMLDKNRDIVKQAMRIDELQKRVDYSQEKFSDLKEDIGLQEYLYQGDSYNQGWNSALKMIDAKLERVLRGEHETD